MAFERNIERLRACDALLAQRVVQADAAHLEPIAAKRGGWTLREGSYLWGSAYAPEREARDWAREQYREPADLLVLIGAGFGHSIEALREIHEGPMLIFEPSPARLQAILVHRGDLAWIDDEALGWSVELEGLATSFQRRYVTGLQVRVLVHPVLEQREPELVRQALTRIAREKAACDINTNTEVLKSREWLDLTAGNTRRLIGSRDFACLESCFRGQPAVVVAAGPSLDKQLPLLRKVADRFVVIAIGQALGALRGAGIEPDLVHVVESLDVAHQLSGAGDVESLDLVVTPSVHPALFELPVRSRFVTYPSTNALGGWIAQAMGGWTPLGGGATVAQSAVRLASALGASSVALIGQDLAFTDGRAYARDSAYAMVGVEHDGAGVLTMTNSDAKGALFGMELPAQIPTAAVEVPGWGGGTVLTSRSYASFLSMYRACAEQLAACGQSLVNCTEGGAHIPGLKHQAFASFVEETATEPLGARERIRALHDGSALPDPAALLAAVGEARQRVRALARDCRRGRSRTKRLLTRRDSSQRWDVTELDRIIGLERRVREVLAEIPWLDDIVRPHVHDATLALARVGHRELEVREALYLSGGLFSAVAQNTDPALELLGVLEKAARHGLESSGATG